MQRRSAVLGRAAEPRSVSASFVHGNRLFRRRRCRRGGRGRSGEAKVVSFLTVPCAKLHEAGYSDERAVRVGVDGDVDERGLARGKGSLDGRSNVFRAVDILAMSAKALSSHIQPDFRIPFGARRSGVIAEVRFVGSNLDPPGEIAGDDADKRQVLADGGFEFGDME